MNVVMVYVLPHHILRSTRFDTTSSLNKTLLSAVFFLFCIFYLYSAASCRYEWWERYMEVGCSVFRGRLLPRVRNHHEKKVCYGKYDRANATSALHDFLHLVDCRSSDDNLYIL